MRRVLSVIIFVALVWGLIFYLAVSKPNDNAFGEKNFVVNQGEGVNKIAARLKIEGFLERPIWFKIYVALTGKRAKFVDGQFLLRTDMNVKELVRALLTFDPGKEVNLTFIEGWTTEEMDDYLVKEGISRTGEFIKYAKTFNQKNYFFLFDRPAGASLEGYLFPDTYRVYRQTDVATIGQKMLENFDQKLTPAWRAEIKRQGKTIFEIVTLASIVEREMFGDENRQKVAGIFWKRLAAGMALQSDATINYITKKGVPRPSLADLQVDNLYNTYKYPGLPPGPIGNPGLEAIKAVIFPKETAYWYFLTTPDGQIIFSKSYEEHVVNKQKYLK